jgi:hypothetical protein
MCPPTARSVVTSVGLAPRSAPGRGTGGLPPDPASARRGINDLPALVNGPVHVHPLAQNLRHVSSTNQRSPATCRLARAASINSG